MRFISFEFGHARAESFVFCGGRGAVMLVVLSRRGDEHVWAIALGTVAGFPV